MTDQLQAPAAPARTNTGDILDKFSVLIELPDGEVAVTDEEFCAYVLNGATRRTAKRYEHEGLPRLEIRGRIFRPLRAGQQWLAARIVAANSTRERRRLTPTRTHTRAHRSIHPPRKSARSRERA
jgi:hypothetical protein